MEKTGLKSKIISGVLFAVFFFLSIGLLLYFGTRKPKVLFPAMDKDKPQVLFLGDSNIDYGFEGTDITVLLKEKTGMVTYNAGIGGTGAGELKQYSSNNDYLSVLNFPNLIRMMQTKDFSAALRNRKFLEESPSGIENKATILAHLDYPAMDYVVVHYGLNDYTVNEPVDDADTYNQNTYCGGLRYGVERIHKLCPNAKIILSSITYCWMPGDNKTRISGYDDITGENTIDVYRDGMEKVADEYEYVYFLDNLEVMGIDDKNCDDYLRDNMHLNQRGRELYVEGLINLLDEIK